MSHFSFPRRLFFLGCLFGCLAAANATEHNPEVYPPDDGEPPYPEPCCEECMAQDSGTGADCASLPSCNEEGSVFFSVGLGRTRFSRDYSFPSMKTKVGKQSYLKPASMRGLAETLDFYTRSPLTGMRNFSVWYHEQTLVSSSFEASALVADPAAHAERIQLGPVIRQILTVDYFADIQPLANVRAGLPADIKSTSEIPTGAPGFVIRTWFAGDEGGKIDGLYQLPAGDPVGYVVFFRKTETVDPVDPSIWSRTLGIIHRVKSTATSYKTQSWTHFNNHEGNWTSVHYRDLPSGDKKLRRSIRTVDSRTGANEFIQTHTVEEAALDGWGTIGSLVLISSTEEQFDDIGGLKRLIRRTQGSNLAVLQQRVTRYGWIDAPANAAIHGLPEWELRPDGSFFHKTYSFSTGATSGSVVTRSPWKDTTWNPDSGTPPADAACVVETTSFTSSSMTVTRKLDGTDFIYKTYSTWTTGRGSDSGLKILLHRNYFGTGTHDFTESWTYYHPSTAEAHLADRIAKRIREDGTVEHYSYSTPSAGTYTQTVDIGAGSSSGVTSGRRTVSVRNARGVVTQRTEKWFSGTTEIQLSTWAVDNVPYSSGTLNAFDFYGRPQGKIHNGESGDYEAVIYSCCGVGYTRDREGRETEYSRDELDRVHKRVISIGSATEIITTDRFADSPFVGMVTETRRASSGLDLLVNESRVTTNGELDQTSTPDGDGDGNPETTTYAYSFPGTGHIVTVTRPDGSIAETAYYLDGRTKTVTGSAVSNVAYDYTFHSVGSGGVVTTLTALDGSGTATGEWIKTYADLAGRTTRTEYPSEIASPPDKDAALTTYYPRTAAAGSRGKVHTTTDPDGVIVTREYHAEGNLSKVTETMPDAVGNRITETLHDATSDSSLGGSLRTVAMVNGITTSTVLDAGDGYGSRENSFGRETLTTRTIASNGGWIELTKHADASRTRRVFENGRLARVENRDNTTGDGNLVSEAAYGYDDLGRLTSTYDSRTGTTYLSNHTAAGNARTVTEPGSRVTTYEFDKMGRRTKVDAPNTPIFGGTSQNITHTSYTSKGQVRAVWGDQTNPVHYQYDEPGRLAVMSTWRDDPPAGEPGAGENDFDNAAQTSWIYHTQRGWLERKEYPDENGTDYEYTAAGRLAVRAWARNVVTEYVYQHGMLKTVEYSGETNGHTTADIVYSYDIFGRVRSVNQGSEVSHTYAYKDDDNGGNPFGIGLGLHSETIDYGTGAPARTIIRNEDDIQRPSGWQLKDGGTAEHAVAYGYDTAGRLNRVHPAESLPATPGLPDFIYHYLGGSLNLLSSVDGLVHTVSNSWESPRDVLNTKINEVTVGSDPPVISSFDYTVNAIGQREKVAPVMDGGAPAAPISTHNIKWDWKYNGRGEVVSADHGSDAIANAGDRFYAFDAIGNRDYIRNGVHVDSGGTEVNYTANALNQYTGTDQNFIHDADGNLEEGTLRYDALTDKDGTGYTATLHWDAENRLVKVLDNETDMIAYDYDYLGRRISRTAGSTTTWYFYDGWNLIAEYAGTTHSKSYTWGMDLSGSLQGAGGVGGLLAVRHETVTGKPSFFPTYDGNGNVTEYLDIGGDVEARFEYDPFGRLIVSTDTSGAFPIRFSTKMLEDKTGLYYYGYRYYDPVTGRWPSRDPIGEEGHELLKQTYFFASEVDGLEIESDLNPYIIAGNNIVDRYDVLGEVAPAVGAVWVGAGAAARYALQQSLKRRLKRIAHCEAIYQAYDQAKKQADKAPCGSCKTCPEYLSHLGFRLAEVLGRKKYLGMRCDYVLPGSIGSAEGSAGKHRNHTNEYRNKKVAFTKCAALALKANCANIPSLP